MRETAPGGAVARAGSFRSGKPRKTSVVERTLQGLATALRDSVFSEKLASRPGLLQGTDPRVKTAGLLTLLVVAGLVRNPAFLLGLYLLTLVLARASSLPIGYFVKRVWLFIPIFAGIIVLPSLFNVVKAGDPLFTIWDFGREVQLGPWSLGDSLAVTRQGLTGAIIFILRVATSVSLAVLLAVTTKWPDLLKSLRVFFVPRIFILILSMTYRYIFLLLSLASDMFTARRSRLVGPSSPREDRHFAAASIGTLLGKSQSLSEDVYAAMVSRGYTGEPRTLHRFQLHSRDLMFALFVVLLSVAAIGGDRLLG